MTRPFFEEFPESLGQGPEGPASTVPGLPGGWTLFYNWESSTSAGASSGALRLNNVTPSSATKVYLSETDRNGVGISAATHIFAAGDYIKIFDAYSPEIFHLFLVTAFADSGSYDTLDVTYITGNGSFTAGNFIGIGLVKKGDQGDPGADGESGAADACEVLYDTEDEDQMTLTSTWTPLSDDLETPHSQTFTVPEGGAKVLFVGTATSSFDGAFRNDAQLGFRLTNGGDTDYYGVWSDSDGLGAALLGFPVAVTRLLTLSAGEYSVDLIAKSVAGYSTKLYRDSDYPAVLAVVVLRIP